MASSLDLAAYLARIRRGGRTVERRALGLGELEDALRDVFGLEPRDDWRPLMERAAAGA